MVVQKKKNVHSDDSDNINIINNIIISINIITTPTTTPTKTSKQIMTLISKVKTNRSLFMEKIINDMNGREAHI